jgi:PKD repeat protein
MDQPSGQNNRRRMTWIIIATIAIVLIIAAIILFVQQSGANEPSVNVSAHYGSGNVLLTHNGGESLSGNDLIVQINGVSIPSSKVSLENNEDWPFSIGKTIIIPYTPSSSPQTLTVYYETGTSRTRIFSTIILPETIPPTASPTISSPITETTTLIPTTTPGPTTVPTTSPPPGPPQATFEALPRTGSYPLTVTFTDLSTGSPDQWEWNFGDGTKSTAKNPVHTYIATGTYTISLKVANTEGANTRIMQNYITVGEPETTEAILDAEGPGSLLPGGFALFRVTGNGARIKVGGKILTPLPGDTVRIVLGSDGQGRISAQDTFILEWTFDDTEVEVNGQPAGRGRISDISIPAYEGFVSNLTLVLPPDSMKGRLIVEGTTTDLSVLSGGLTLRDFVPDRAGDLVVDTSLPGTTYVQGRIATIVL